MGAAAPSGAVTDDVGSSQDFPAGAASVEGSAPQVIDEVSTTTHQPDGSYLFEGYSRAVNAQDDSGEWHALDPALATDSSGGPVASVGEVTVEFPEDGADAVVVETPDFRLAQDVQGMKGELASDGDSVSYESTYGEVVFEANADGLKESLVLDRSPDQEFAVNYRLRFSSDSRIALNASAGTVEFTDSKDRLIAELPPPVMWDDSGTESSALKYVLRDVSTGTATLVVVPTSNWLWENDRSYPVIVDPSVTFYPSTDCTIAQATPSNSSCGSNNRYFKLGLDAGGSKLRGLAAFDVSAIPTDAVIKEATLKLYLDATRSTSSAGASYVAASAGNAFGSTATWATNGLGASWSGGSPTTPKSSEVALSGGTSGYRDFDIKALIDVWRSGGANRGVVLKQVEETVANSISFYTSSANNSVDVWPKIIVKYDRPPTVPVSTLAPCQADCSATGMVVVKSSTPSITVTSSDADSPTLTYTVRLLDAESQSITWTQSMSGAGQVQMTVPPGTLSTGKPYEAQVTVSDGVSSIAAEPLLVVYNSTEAPAVPSGLQVDPCGLDDCSTSSTTTLARPTLSASLGSSEGYQQSVRFEVRSVGSQAVLLSGNGGTIDDGAVSRFTLPTALSDGAYEFRVVATDDAGASTSSTWKGFSVQAAAVAPPALVSMTPCSGDCSRLTSPSLTPTISARTSVSGQSNVVFQIAGNGNFIAEGVAAASSSGQTVTWTVPEGTLGSGGKLLRLGTEVSGTRYWTAWVPVALTGSDDGTAFPLESNPATTGTDSATGTYAPSRSLDAEDAGPKLTATSSQTEYWSSQMVAPGTENASTPYDLAKNFAPIYWFDSEEKYFPLSATTFLNHSRLGWHHKCGKSRMWNSYSVETLGDGGYEHQTIEGRWPLPTCDTTHEGEMWQSNELPSTRPREEGGPEEDEGFFLDLENGLRDGGCCGDPNFRGDEPVYYRYVSKRYIAYYTLFGDSAVANPGFETISHEGDWEFVWILLNSKNRPAAVEYGIHGKSCYLDWKNVPKRDGHPYINVGNHSHSNYPRGYHVRLDDDASGDGERWYGSANLKQSFAEPWWGYTGGWGEVGSLGVTTGPMGPSPDKAAPTYPDSECDD